MAAVRQPFVSSRGEVPLPCIEAAVVIREPVPGGMPYGPAALTVLGGPAGALPYGPLALTVLGGPAGAMRSGPWALGGLVPSDAPAAAGIARHRAQTPVAMRRGRMVT